MPILPPTEDDLDFELDQLSLDGSSSITSSIEIESGNTTTAEDSIPSDPKPVRDTRPIIDPNAMIKLVVGPQQEVILIGQHYIIKSSPFFYKAITGAWLEAEEQTIYLPEDRPDVVKFYIHFLRKGDIEPTGRFTYGNAVANYGPDALLQHAFLTEYDMLRDPNMFSVLENDELFFRGFMFADKILDSDFADALLFYLAEAMNVTWFSNSAINYIYDHTQSDAEIRKIIHAMWRPSAAHAFNQIKEALSDADRPMLYAQFGGFKQALEEVGYCAAFLKEMMPLIIKVTDPVFPGFLPRGCFPYEFQLRWYGPNARGLLDTGDLEDRR